jgi:hypothetical protein
MQFMGRATERYGRFNLLIYSISYSASLRDSLFKNVIERKKIALQAGLT